MTLKQAKHKKKQVNEALEEELLIFEDFFQTMGFKRIDGAIYGLLCLAKDGMTSQEIESSLHLSQSSVSQSLKTLYLYGILETKDLTEFRKKIHVAKVDTLCVVASIFRKREQESIEKFKNMISKALKRIPEEDRNRRRRLKSIISTSEIAESVINFIIKLSNKEHPLNYDKLPALFNTILNISQSNETIHNLSSQLLSKFFKPKEKTQPWTEL